jgi:hypothetical protein
MSQNSNSEETRLTNLVTQLRDDGCEFFLNSQLVPTVKIPDDAFQTEWPVDSQRVQDLLVSIHYEITYGQLLRSVERDFLLSQLREECRKGGRRFTEVEADETDKNVIVQGILCLMNKKDLFDDRTVVLLQTMTQFQSTGAIPVDGGIPVFANIFSRKLKRLIPVMKGYGVEMSLRHKEDGSYCTIRRLDSFAFEPDARDFQPLATDDSKDESSGESSVRIIGKGSDLQAADGSDGNIRFDSASSKIGMMPPAPGVGETDAQGNHASPSSPEPRENGGEE